MQKHNKTMSQSMVLKIIITDNIIFIIASLNSIPIEKETTGIEYSGCIMY